MRNRVVERGDVLLVSLPSHSPSGHEQMGTSPVVVAAVPPEPLRYPVVVVVPLTTHGGQWVDANPSVYYPLRAGAAGLPLDSTALIDQVRSLDVRRVLGYIGTPDARDTRMILSKLLDVFSA